MACPGGCVGGAGQPISTQNGQSRGMRSKGLYRIDKDLQLHKSQENIFITECYEKLLGENGKAHKMLHTSYQGRRRTPGEIFPIISGGSGRKVEVSVCLGTSCFLRGSDQILRGLVRETEEHGIERNVDIRASFCFEQCDRGPTVVIDGERIERCAFEQARDALGAALDRARDSETSAMARRD